MRWEEIFTLLACHVVAILSAQEWVQFGDGFQNIDGTVHSLLYDSDSDLLYAGGNFIDAATDEVTSRIAVWDGLQWSSMGCGFQWDCDQENVPNPWQNPVLDIIKFQDTIYVCGAFSFSGDNELNNVAKWDGTQWLGVGNGLNDIARQFKIINDQLYVVGRFTESPGYATLAGFAQWNGNGWEDPTNLEPPDSTQPQSVSCIEEYQGEIYIGGNLTINGWESALIKWDGNSWAEVSGHIFGFISVVEDLDVFQESLFVAGNYSTEADGQWRNAVSAWNGISWDNLNSGIRYQENQNNPGHVREIVASEEGVFVVGTFAYAGDVAADHVAWWNGEHWCGYGSDNLMFIANAPIYAIEVMDNQPIIGGYFHEIDGQDIRKVAQYVGIEDCLVSGIEDEPAPIFTVFIESSSLVVQSDQMFSEIEIYDAQGRLIQVESLNDRSFRSINISGYCNGIYIIRIPELGYAQKVYIR